MKAIQTKLIMFLLCLLSPRPQSFSVEKQPNVNIQLPTHKDQRILPHPHPKFSHFTFADRLLFSTYLTFPNILGYVKNSHLLLHKIEIELRSQLKLFKN